jgi:hypothetical protein
MAQAAGGATPGLEDIVVTATKRETNLQKIPIAISMVGERERAHRGRDRYPPKGNPFRRAAKAPRQWRYTL